MTRHETPFATDGDPSIVDIALSRRAVLDCHGECGLIEDWASWQREDGDAFRQFSAALRDLSPDGESLEPGPLSRILEDADRRDIPTLIVPYGASVPIVYARRLPP